MKSIVLADPSWFGVQIKKKTPTANTQVDFFFRKENYEILPQRNEKSDLETRVSPLEWLNVSEMSCPNV